MQIRGRLHERGICMSDSSIWDLLSSVNEYGAVAIQIEEESDVPCPKRPLPAGWKQFARSGVLQVISPAQFAVNQARGRAAEHLSTNGRVRAENQRLRAELALVREKLRIKDARMGLIVPRHRPHYPPAEWMAILEMRGRLRLEPRQDGRNVHGHLRHDSRMGAEGR
jgi:hypothetical protein